MVGFFSADAIAPRKHGTRVFEEMGNVVVVGHPFGRFLLSIRLRR
jgi:hypothetical protein